MLVTLVTVGEWVGGNFLLGAFRIWFIARHSSPNSRAGSIVMSEEHQLNEGALTENARPASLLSRREILSASMLVVGGAAIAGTSILRSRRRPMLAVAAPSGVPQVHACLRSPDNTPAFTRRWVAHGGKSCDGKYPCSMLISMPSSGIADESVRKSSKSSSMR